MRLSAVAIVAGIVLAILSVTLLVRPPATEPENPFGGLQLSTDRARYTFGERMTLFLVNHGDRLILFTDWTVQRSVGGDWIPVECHVITLDDKILDAGATMTWIWTVADESPESCEEPFATVEEGLYRGSVRFSLFANPLERGQLFADFEVV